MTSIDPIGKDPVGEDPIAGKVPGQALQERKDTNQHG